MTADEVIRLVNAIGGVLGVLVWPTVVLLLAIRFRAALEDFFSHLGEFSLKAPGLEASARRQQVKAAAALGAAVATHTGGTPENANPSDVADVLTAAVPNTRSQRRLQDRLVLWVDDQPSNNRYERQALEALGMRFAISTSTDDALEQLRHQSFDLIISDMARPPDAQAGYTLLDKLRNGSDRTPLVIYASSSLPEHIQEARRHGALGCTNSPQELVRIITKNLAGR